MGIYFLPSSDTAGKKHEPTHLERRAAVGVGVPEHREGGTQPLTMGRAGS